MDYLAQLELDIKKEQVDLISQLAQGKNILRFTQILPFCDVVRNPLRRKIKMIKDHYLKSVNLIVYGENLENKLGKILKNYYFEIAFENTKFSNTGTLTSSRLFERYLSKYLDNQCEDIFKSETCISINIFDFRYTPINIPDLVLELYVQERADRTVSLSFEYIYEFKKIDSTLSGFVRPKNGSDFYVHSESFEVTQLIRNSGYCYGMVLCFIPEKSESLEFEYPSLENILIYPGNFSFDDYKEFGPDDFKIIETPVYKYIVLIFDPNYRSDENICDMLDGYLFDSKKIYGLNFSDTTDPSINLTNKIDEEDDEEYGEEEFACCSYKLKFNRLDPHGDIRVHENFYYLDCV